MGSDRADTLLGGRKIVGQITFWFSTQYAQMTREAIIQDGLQSSNKFLCACAFCLGIEVLGSKSSLPFEAALMKPKTVP